MEGQGLLPWATLVLALSTVVLAVATIWLWRSSRAMASNEVFRSLVERYASAEMLIAVKRLYDSGNTATRQAGTCILSTGESRVETSTR